MEIYYYKVALIDGDYAHLQRLDAPGEDLKLVARALLPDEIDVGTKLVYEMFSYEICEE